MIAFQNKPENSWQLGFEQTARRFAQTFCVIEKLVLIAGDLRRNERLVDTRIKKLEKHSV